MANKSENINEILPRLAKFALFEDFDLDNQEDKRILTKVYEHTSTKNFRKGEIIIKEGDIGSEFYMLYSGSVHISRNTPAGDSIALADLNDGMNIFFGETALISNDTRTATVSALTDCTVMVLTDKDFFTLSDQEPLLGYRVLKVLAKRMSKTLREMNKDKATLYQALFNEIADSGI